MGAPRQAGDRLGVLGEPATSLPVAVDADVPAALENDLEVQPVDRLLRPPAVDDPPFLTDECHLLAVHDSWRPARARLDERRSGSVETTC